MNFIRKIGFLIFLIAFGCNEKKAENKNTIISIRETASEENLDINNPHLLKLESNSFAQIAGIDKVLFYEDRIAVLDKIRGNSVFVFDSKGKYINYIYRIGEGPGEYRNVENIFWDPFTKRLVLIPMDFKKKLYFDPDGNYIKEEFFKQELTYADLFFLEQREIVVNQSFMNLEPNLMIYENQKLKFSAIPYDSKKDNSPMNVRNVISRIDEENFLFTTGLRDTLYKISIDQPSVEPLYTLDFQNEISFEKFSEYPDPLQYFTQNDLYVGAIDLFQDSDFLSFSTLHHRGIKGRIFSKRSGKTYSTQKLIQQKIGDLGFQGVLGMTLKNEFVAVLSPGETMKWDFSLNQDLEKQFADFGEVDKDELILLIFELEEDL